MASSAPVSVYSWWSTSRVRHVVDVLSHNSCLIAAPRPQSCFLSEPMSPSLPPVGTHGVFCHSSSSRMCLATPATAYPFHHSRAPQPRFRTVKPFCIRSRQSRHQKSWKKGHPGSRPWAEGPGLTPAARRAPGPKTVSPLHGSKIPRRIARRLVLPN